MSETILQTGYTAAQVEAARVFLESCPYTTTALIALSVALTEMSEGEAPRVAQYLNASVLMLAEIEAEEM